MHLGTWIYPKIWQDAKLNLGYMGSLQNITSKRIIWKCKFVTWTPKIYGSLDPSKISQIWIGVDYPFANPWLHESIGAWIWGKTYFPFLWNPRVDSLARCSYLEPRPYYCYCFAPNKYQVEAVAYIQATTHENRKKNQEPNT